MIKFYRFLFVASCCTTFTIFGSTLELLINPQSPTSPCPSPTSFQTAFDDDDLTNVTALPIETIKPISRTHPGTGAGAGAGTGIETSEPTASQLIKSSIKPSDGSSLFTKAAAGIASLCGKSRTSILFDLYQDGTLQADAQKNLLEAIGRILDAMDERYNKDLTNRQNQEKIERIFDIIKDIKKKTTIELEICIALAQKYNDLQAAALTRLLDHQATTLQPEYQKEKEDAIELANQIHQKAIKNANEIYTEKMKLIGNVTSLVARNKRRLEKRIPSSIPCQDAKTEHYQTTITYENLLKSKREVVTSSIFDHK